MTRTRTRTRTRSGSVGSGSVEWEGEGQVNWQGRSGGGKVEGPELNPPTLFGAARLGLGLGLGAAVRMGSEEGREGREETKERGAQGQGEGRGGVAAEKGHNDAASTGSVDVDELFPHTGDSINEWERPGYVPTVGMGLGLGDRSHRPPGPEEGPTLASSNSYHTDPTTNHTPPAATNGDGGAGGAQQAPSFEERFGYSYDYVLILPNKLFGT